MKQQLRTHPALRYRGLSSWPPAWGGAYAGAARLPVGEEGILRRVERVEEVPGLNSPALDLSIAFDGRAFNGLLMVDDGELLPLLELILREHIDQPLAEIGALAVDLPVRPSTATHVEAEILAQDKTLAEVVRHLAEAYEPRAIYLFGSRARGESRADSDYDLLVVVPDDALPERRSSARGYQCLRGIGKAVDVLVCTEDYFRARWRVKTSLPTKVAHLRKLVHCAYAS